MSGNGDEKCSGATVKVFSTLAMNLCGGPKDVCRHVSTLTLKSVMELRKSVKTVL